MHSPRAAVYAGRELAGRPSKALRNEWLHLVRRMPVQRDVVLYEAFGGRGVLCHPEAIFRELLASEDLQHLRHVWALKNVRRDLAVVREFKGDPRVTFVQHGTYAYTKALTTAGYLINNATFRPSFAKRDEQIYLNTWHGTPLKKMGHDEPGETAATRNVLRNFLMSDFLLSSGDYMTRSMYESAYRLINVFAGSIIEEGSPRTDRQFVGSSEKSHIRSMFRKRGLAVQDAERLVLYAPTWRGSSFSDPRDDAIELAARVRLMQDNLGSSHRVLLKVHQQIFDLVQRHSEVESILVPNDVPTNVVLATADVLVTDFSSVLFDALATVVPMVFLAPDVEEYEAQRGLYVAPSELPGPMALTAHEAAHLVGQIGSGSVEDPLVTHAVNRERARRIYAEKDDGESSSRIVDIVFRKRSGHYAVSGVKNDGRQTILMYLGGMKSNGITTAGLNLLHNIDPSRFDVTAVYRHARSGDRRHNADAISPSTRRLARIGSFTTSKAHRRKRLRLLNHGGHMTPQEMHVMMSLLDREWRRCIGSARFDYIVDFSGYSPFWSFLMAVAPTGSRSIWLHNDLRADQMREVDGVRPFENHLGATFSSYRFYDNLVSVSSALRDINAVGLSEFSGRDKFMYARNTIDAGRIVSSAFGDDELLAAWPGDQVLAPVDASDEEASPSPRSLASQHGVQELAAEIGRRQAMALSPRREGIVQFVAVGRISPEKNHARLVRAFASVHAWHPNTRLVIVGDGPLRAEVESLVTRMGLEGSVVMTGLLSNPWALMAQCDVFVLSSDYEGQPMVILEALVLGLPVVTTAFGSVASALPPGTGLVVARDEGALAEGMESALRGDVPVPVFDSAEYNREVMAEFYCAIGADQC